MKFQFSHPMYLLLLPVAWAWVGWLAWKTDVQISSWRRHTATSLRFVVVTAVILALAGLQWMRPMEGMNVLFVLDRSDSIPSTQQEGARNWVNETAGRKKDKDKAGILVFGADAAIETSPNPKLNVEKINAVVGADRTDLGAAIRLATAAFPETGQKRIVLLSDGNENIGDAIGAATSARSLGVSLDVAPLGVQRGNDLSVQKLGLPNRIKKGQTFEAKIFVQADQAQTATVRLYRNQQPLGEQKVQLSAGKNLYTFPQTLDDPGFYNYSVFLEAPGDNIPQNNQATSFITVRGDPRVLIVSTDLEQDASLAAALQTGKLEIKLTGVSGFPSTLAEMQSYDAIFISNLAAGDIGSAGMKLLESAVRDFGVGLVCIGGDQTYAAGGYRNTPLETALPVNMELDSKKVLPNGAVALVMHGMEFANGNQVARDCALGVLDALGPNDEMGVVLWDGSDRWLFPMTKVGDKAALGRKIAGMNQGDLPTFQNVMSMAHQGLKATTANLKHMIIFSDGDPAPPSQALMQTIVGDRVTVSTVLISGHAPPDTMVWIADQGRGRHYPVDNAAQLPQIFIKEAAVILKSAIFEEPFRPKLVSSSELIRGIGPDEYPLLRGYVCTTAKARAETPLLSDKGDPVLAHWQYGLGRTVAFTSDAKAKWARDWMGWGKYRQFWSQISQWSLRRVENVDFTTEVSIDKGAGVISVEALDEKGEYRNFLNLQTLVVSPKGERQSLRLEQTGPGRYEAKFDTREVGSYSLNLMEYKEGKLAGSQFIGASVNYSPEFSAPEPNVRLLHRLAEIGGGKVLDPLNASDNPFTHDRIKTYQPRDLWEWLMRFAIILFTADVGIRRIQLDREEVLRALAWLREKVFFWKPVARPVEAEESLAALLARREQVRQQTTAPDVEPSPELFRPRQTPAEPIFAEVGTRPSADQAEPAKETTPTPPPAAKPATTASRLLEAKNRAKKKME